MSTLIWEIEQNFINDITTIKKSLIKCSKIMEQIYQQKIIVENCKYLAFQPAMQDPINQNDQFLQALKNKTIIFLSSQFQNKILFPDRVGPHYAYTLNDPQEKPKISILNIELPRQLHQKAKKYFADKLLPCKKQSPKLQNLKIESPETKEPSQKEDFLKSLGIIQNNKYKKYSPSLKKRIIAEIQQEIMQAEEHFPKTKRFNQKKKLRFLAKKKSMQYEIHPKNILRWLETKQKIQNDSGRKPKYPELQEELFKFVANNPNAKRRNIIRQAKAIAEVLDVNANFLFSKGWYQRFKNRYRKKSASSQHKKVYPENNIFSISLNQKNSLYDQIQDLSISQPMMLIHHNQEMFEESDQYI